MLYGVDFDDLASLDDTSTAVVVPETDIPQLSLQFLQMAIDPLDKSANDDYAVSSFCNALQILSQTIGVQ